MRVISKAKTNETEWRLRVTCTRQGNKNRNEKGCGAVLEVTKADLFHTYRSFMGRDEEWYVTIKCPECGGLTDLGDKTPFIGKELPHYKDWEKRRIPTLTQSDNSHDCHVPMWHCSECLDDFCGEQPKFCPNCGVKFEVVKTREEVGK